MQNDGKKQQEQTFKRRVLIATGASGGHVYPALATAAELSKQNIECVFTGAGWKVGEIIRRHGYKFEPLPQAPMNVSNPIKKAFALFQLGRSYLRIRGFLSWLQPSCVIGTGGYSTVALLLAAKHKGVPSVIHEQNVLPGRANRMAAQWADKIAISFEESRKYFKDFPKKLEYTGNPIRPDVWTVAEKERPLSLDKFRILVIGGSQGARILSDVVPEAMDKLEKDEQRHIHMTQQARPEDVNRVIRAYKSMDWMNTEYEVSAFFDNLPERMHQADLIISRAGAGTLFECAALGRAGIFIPLELADGHQRQNAQVFANAKAAVVLEQKEFTAEAVLKHVRQLMHNRDMLRDMERRIKMLARPHAAADVARLVAVYVNRLAPEKTINDNAANNNQNSGTNVDTGIQ